MLGVLLCAICIGVVVAVPLEENDSVRRLVERHIKRAAVADFDEHIRRWVGERGVSVNRKVSWFDAYGNHEHLSSRPQYNRYQVKVETESIRYGDIQRSIEQPQQVYSKWYCNNQEKQPITTTISREIQRKTSYSWSTERGIKIGVSVSISASVPGVMDVNAGLSTDVDFRSGSTNSQEDTETFKIQYDLTIDPKTAVKADWIITEREVVIPYEADIHINGYVSVWFDQKYEGHWLWFYPTHYLAGGEFRQVGSGLVYKATGVFRGVKGVDSVIRTSELPVGSGKCNNDNVYYHNTTPRKVTTTKLPFGKHQISSGVNGD